MTKRINRRFNELNQSDRSALITFLTAGDPNYETSLDIVKKLPDVGVDLIELGMPFSDPMADGPSVQAANLRALSAGMTLKRTLQLVSDFRQNDDEMPVILMGYYNPVHHYGCQKFIDDALQAGVDGLIIVDLPVEEDDALCHLAMTSGLAWIRLITPTTDEKRLQRVLKYSSGFVYYVSVAGVTGTKSADHDDINKAVSRIKQHTKLPVAVGFGIKHPDQLEAIFQVADAAVVGSAIVDCISNSVEQQDSARILTTNVLDFVKQLAAAK